MSAPADRVRYTDVLIATARDHAKACESKGLTAAAGALRDLADALRMTLDLLAEQNVGPQ